MPWAGIVFGAYHFARPDNTSNDATIEADHFTSVAAPRSGDLLPEHLVPQLASDLEATNGGGR